MDCIRAFIQPCTTPCTTPCITDDDDDVVIREGDDDVGTNDDDYDDVGVYNDDDGVGANDDDASLATAKPKPFEVVELRAKAARREVLPQTHLDALEEESELQPRPREPTVQLSLIHI